MYGNRENMEALLKFLEIDLNWYKVPLEGDEKVKVSIKDKQRVVDFNSHLDLLAQQKVYPSPFIVTINVGDLKGNGDITAGAKLARELSLLLPRITEWKDARVCLYLAKIAALEEEGKASEVKRVIELAESILKDAPVQLVNVTKATNPQQVKQVDFAYAATNLGGVDFSISQYGYDQFPPSFTPKQYGSGPGYGCLGILPVTADQQKNAIIAYTESKDDLLAQIAKLRPAPQDGSFHFGYFSIYEDRPKGFIKSIYESSKKDTLCIAIARSADSLINIGKGYSGQGNTVVVHRITKAGVIQESQTFAPRGHAKRTMILLDLFEGVAPDHMLALYYGSDNPVGATGDQSFVEAYMMRARSQRSSDMADILYDVAAQQTLLRRQLDELVTKTLTLGKEGQRGLNKLLIEPAVVQAMNNKNLLYSVLLLINNTLMNKD